MEIHPDTRTDQEPEWVVMYTRSPMGPVSSTHRVPCEEFVHELDLDGACVCGPWRVDAPVPFFRHWPLSERFWVDGELID